MDNQLLKHLQHTGLGQYICVLQENGYTSWSQLMTVTEEDLHRLGFKLGHRRRLQREIATIEGYPVSGVLPFCQMSTTQVTSTSAGASGSELLFWILGCISWIPIEPAQLEQATSERPLTLRSNKENYNLGAL
jgi:hypothetical protein